MWLHQRLASVDLKVLEKLVARSVADTKSRYPQRDENRTAMHNAASHRPSPAT
jgi:hypothetical protein